MQEGPRLLIGWERRGQSFVESLGPALSRSSQRLAIEMEGTPRPTRPMLLSYVLHLVTVFAVVWLPAREAMRTPNFVSPVDFAREHYEIVYLPEHELPQMTDRGGASAGSSGAAGGRALYSPAQAIRIARGNLVVPNVVDVPKLRLPRVEVPANLLVSSAPAPSVPPSAIQHERITTVQAFASAPVPPAPQIARERLVSSPILPVTPVPPPVTTSVRDAVAGSKLELPTPVAPPPEQIKRTEAATIAAIRAGVPPVDVTVVDVGRIAPQSARDTAVVISSQPGASVGKPSAESPGAMSMASSGAGKPGIGEGSGTSAGHGVATGSRTKGGRPGTATAGIGAGGDVSAQSGISAAPGPGGSGAGMIATAILGVTISGGKVMIPSFGATPAAGAGTARMPGDARNVRPVTIVATARAGGAVSARGILKGSRVYTIYMDTTAGLAFLQFAEHASADAFQQDLTAPEPLVSKVPDELRSARVLLAGVMDRNGSLRNLRVVEAASQQIAHALIEAVGRWHFRPALRGDEPVELDAILGLNVDTR